MEREVIGRPFKPGHRNTHDCAAAGRKGKANSPWRNGCGWLAGGGTRRERIHRALALPRNRRNGNGDAVSLRDPLDTITTRDRLALVTVTIRGTPYVIVDIGLRMLKPHELYRAQGFPADYIIDRTADGTPLTISQQVRMVGNSVSPPPLCALATTNLNAVVPQAVAA